MDESNLQGETSVNPLERLTSLTKSSTGEIVEFMTPNAGNVGLVSRNILQVVDEALKASANGVTAEQILEAVNQAATNSTTT